MKKTEYRIIYTDEVYEALKKKKPVVALESTIIAQGMPYPKNVETSIALENILREMGVTPATIAIIDGDISVGLTHDQIEDIGNGKREVMKVSRRDLPIVIGRKLTGATTVSSSIYIASLAGIPVFATGGIGGVHFFQNQTRDISNDLEELALDNVVVVSAGVKSILDIANTLEYLETKGVPVIGFRSKEMPAFFTRESGIFLEYESDSAKDIANIARAKWGIGLNGGILIANPIPEEYSYPKENIDKAIKEALEKASEEKIQGKRITPFLLKTIVDETGGKSLEANIALVKNNVKLAGEIAKEFSKL